MFAVSQSSYFPLFRSCKIFEWNFVIVFLSCSGAFWAVCVFLRRATPYLQQKAKNQWSDALKSAFSGLRSFTNCIIWVLNHHRLTTLPSLRMVLNSSYKSFSKERKKGWWPQPLDLLRGFWFLIFSLALTHMRTSFLSICRQIYFFSIVEKPADNIELELSTLSFPRRFVLWICIFLVGSHSFIQQ